MVLKVCNQPYNNESYESYFQTYDFPLSDFQKYAIEAIVENHHVLVTAHTGSGKTLPAEFAIEHLVKQGKKVIYTSPIKALSNQKFSEFTRKYPHISFGLLTGDIKTNPEADVLIMTTEILMNYLFLQTNGDASQIQDCQLQFKIDLEKELACVVFDEVHYINDADRGQTWEKTILMLPYHVQMVMLSATIDAPERFAKWVMRGDQTKDVYLASTNKRVVPLTHYGFLTTNDGVLKTIQDKVLVKDIRDHTNKLVCLQSDKGAFQEDGYKTLKRIYKTCKDKNLQIKRKQVLNNACKFLRNNDMLPAICFVFSRKQVEVCASELTIPLLNDETRESYNIAKECEQIVRRLPNAKEYLELPEYRTLVSLLEKGIGIHHSGMIPILREIVEIMISKKYIQLLFATESFAIGLDCPIKTAMFSSLTKYDGHFERLLMGHEYTQMAGRAGRRGIDTIGHVVHLNNLFPFPMQSEYQTILKGKPQNLVSKFRISYGLLFSLLKNGKNRTEDFRDFVSNSMIKRELDNEIHAQQSVIQDMESKLASIRDAPPPCDPTTLQTYHDLAQQLAGKLSNNKRRQCEAQMVSLKKENKTLLQYLEREKEQEELAKSCEKERHRISYLDHFIEDNLENMARAIMEYGFIEKPDEHYALTQRGIIASNIAEVHPMILTLLLEKYAMFEEISLEQLIGCLAAFTNVNVDKEVKKCFPHSEDACVKEMLIDLEEWHKEFADLENMEHLESGYDYENALNYDMPDLAIQWMKCSDEDRCKEFLYHISREKGISSGDFTKAMLKVSTIARELSVVAELFGNMQCLQKLKQVDGCLLKYISTSQSLYV